MARHDDLVLIFCEAITACWKRIIYFKPDESVKEAAPVVGAVDLPFDVPEGFSN